MERPEYKVPIMAVPTKQITLTFALTAAQRVRLRQEAAALGWTTGAVILRHLGLSPWPEGVPVPSWPPIPLPDGSEVAPAVRTPQRAA
jgi:hypothetical protein